MKIVPMRVAVDLDNTLADTTGMLTALTNFKHGTKLTKADIVCWDFWRDAGYEETFWQIYDMMDKLRLRRALPPVDPLACAIVKTLIKKGHTVHVVSANKPEAKDSIEAWLFGHGLDPRVILIGRISAAEKVKLDYDLFIDDSPMFEAAMADVPEKLLILLDQPWNQEVKAVKNIIRAKDWRDIQRILEELAYL